MTYGSLKLTIFSAPWVIISKSSSLLAAVYRISVYVIRPRGKLTLGSLLPPLLNNQLIKAQFLRRPFKHALFDTFFGDKPEYVDLFCLADAVGAIHGLQIGLRIPATS